MAHKDSPVYTVEVITPVVCALHVIVVAPVQSLADVESVGLINRIVEAPEPRKSTKTPVDAEPSVAVIAFPISPYTIEVFADTAILTIPG